MHAYLIKTARALFEGPIIGSLDAEFKLHVYGVDILGEMRGVPKTRTLRTKMRQRVVT